MSDSRFRVTQSRDGSVEPAADPLLTQGALESFPSELEPAETVMVPHSLQTVMVPHSLERYHDVLVRSWPRVRPFTTVGALVALISVAGLHGDPQGPGLTDARSLDFMSAGTLLAHVENAALTPLAPLRTAVTPLRAAFTSPTSQPPPSQRPGPAANLSRGRPRAELGAIQRVLNRYRDAMSTLNAAAVGAIWPSVDASGMHEEFASIVEQNLDFASCRIATAGVTARASCAGVIESGFNPGNLRPELSRRRWQFTLHKVRERWLITNVTHAPLG